MLHQFKRMIHEQNDIVNKDDWAGVNRDFPGSPVVKTLPSNAKGAGSSPGGAAKNPQASWPKTQNIKRKQHCRKFIKDFKNSPH